MASEALQTIIDLLRNRPPAESMTMEEYRAGLDDLGSSFALPEGTRGEPLTFAGRPAEWVQAGDAKPGRTILFLHGGAYVRGSIVSHRGLVARLCARSGARALVIEYRLAPENPHPAALEDALAAYRQLIAEGIDPASLVVAGDSAGGGMTLALLVALRDGGDPLPRAAVTLSPWSDLAITGESVKSRVDQDPFLDGPYLHLMAGRYLGGQDPRTPSASPLFADLHGLPPLLVQVGSAECLRDDSLRVAEKARAAGVEVTFEEWPEMIHVWHLFAHALPEGQQAIDRVGEWLEPHWP